MPRIQSDLILLDTAFHPLDWMLKETTYAPAELLKYVTSKLKKLPINPATLTYSKMNIALELRLQPIRTSEVVGILLAINNSGDNFDTDALTQAAEVMKLFMHVWRLTRSSLCELDALLQGGLSGQKERDIRMLTVIRNEGGTSLDLVTERLSMINMLKSCSTFLSTPTREVTYFSGSIVIADLTEQENNTALLFRKLKKELHLTKPVCAAKYSMPSGMGDVQQIYSIIVHTLPIAIKIFPRIAIYREKEITFAYDIYKLLQQPKSSDALTEILLPLMADSRWNKHKETLETFFLDCNASLSDSAATLGIHVNTLKYRIQTISDILGQKILSSVCSSRIILALALLRSR